MTPWEWEILGMENSSNKHFSANLIALQMQLKTLMEDSGGDKVVALLDMLCQLGEEEQRLVLGHFINIVQKISNGDIRLKSELDVKNAQFEDDLYSDILQAFNQQSLQKSRFELLQGGKNDHRKCNKILEMKKFSQSKVLQ